MFIEIRKNVTVQVLILRMTIFFWMELCVKIIYFIYKFYIPGLKGQVTTTYNVYSCVVYATDISERRFICYTECTFITTVLQILALTTNICTFIL